MSAGGRPSNKEREIILKRQNMVVEAQMQKDFRILEFRLNTVSQVISGVMAKTRNPVKSLAPEKLAEYAVRVTDNVMEELSKVDEAKAEEMQAGQQIPPEVAAELKKQMAAEAAEEDEELAAKTEAELDDSIHDDTTEQQAASA